MVKKAKDNIYREILILFVIIFLIVNIFCKKIYNISSRKVTMISLLIFIIVLSPSLRSLHHNYYNLLIVIIIILCIISIININIPLKIKVIVCITLCLIYNKNIRLIYNIIYTAVNTMYNSNRNDNLLNDKVTNIYKNVGLEIISNFEQLPSTPSILVANYCRDRIENPFCVTIPKKLAILMQRGFRKINMNGIINYPIYVEGHGQGNFENISTAIKNAIELGNYVFVYINEPSYYDYIGRLKSGIFKIAKQHNIPVTPIAFDYIDTFFGYIPNQKYHIKVGETNYVTDVNKSRYMISKYYKKCQKEFKKSKY